MPRFSFDATDEETELGFRIVERDGIPKALVVMLSPGVCVVKMIAANGSVEYAICDDELRPLYVVATSLADLRERFARG